MGMISPEILQQLYGKWQERLNRDDGELLKKIICIDGKTMRSNKKETKKHPTLYRHGVKRTDSALVRKQLRKKVMKSQQYQNCWIKYR